MDRIPEQSSEILLARINRELERISETQHRLARRRTLLQEQATRLRLGASASEVRLAIKASAVESEERGPFPTRWPRERRAVEERERFGGSLL